MPVLWFGRPEKTVLLYCVGNRAYIGGKGTYINVRLFDSTFLLVRYPLCTIVTSGALRDSLLRQAE
jgi:hypothetical protein